MSNPTRIATTVLASAALLAGSYALYFDYQRRNNPEFRKSIRLQKKKAQAAEEGAKKELKARLDKELRVAIAQVQREPTPTSPEQQEAFFQECVAEGEKLATMGPEKQVESAMHFFRALRVYPNPVELLMIYQKVVPPSVFELVVQAMQLAPGSGAGAAPGGRGGLPLGVGTGMPAPVDASLADLDDSPVSGPGGESEEWDSLSRE